MHPTEGRQLKFIHSSRHQTPHGLTFALALHGGRCECLRLYVGPHGLCSLTSAICWNSPATSGDPAPRRILNSAPLNANSVESCRQGTLRKADLGSPDLQLGQAGGLRISGAILLLCTMCSTMAPSATCGFKLIWKPGDLEFCFSDENHRTFSCSSMSPLCFSFYYDNSHCYLKEMRKPHHSSISC